jgi:ferredoxin-fold anticodon binding domain-containing protein
MIIILAMVGICLLEKTANDKNDEKVYNNGICTECGGDYIFSSAVHVCNIDGSEDDYYYTCNKCGHTVKTDSIMK